MKTKVNSIILPRGIQNAKGSLNIDAITLLASLLLSPKFANIQSIKLLFGLRLSPEEIKQQLKNRNSLLHRIISEMVIMFCKYVMSIKEIAFRQLLEQFRRKEIKDAIEQERLEERDSKLKEYLKNFDWDQARENLQVVSRKKHNFVQNLLLENLTELNYLMALNIDEKSKKQILDAIIKRNEIMERKAIIADDLARMLETVDLSPERREEIVEEIARYERHLELSTLEMKLKMISDYINDPDKIVQVTRKSVQVEEIGLFAMIGEEQNISINKAIQQQKETSSSYLIFLRNQQINSKPFYNEIAQHFALALDLYTEKYTEDSLPFLSTVIQLLKDMNNFDKEPSEELKSRIEENVERIAEIIPSDEKFKNFMGALKKGYRENILPFKNSDILSSEDNQKEKSKSTDSTKIPHEEQAKFTPPVEFHTPQLVEEKESKQQVSKEEACYQANQKDKETLLSIVSWLKTHSAQVDESEKDLKQDLKMLTKISEKLVSGKMLKNEVAGAYSDLVDRYNGIANKYPDLLGLNDLYQDIKSLSLINYEELNEPATKKITIIPSPGPGADF